MNPLTQFKKISILPLLIALALLVRATPAAAQANEVTHWNQIATSTLVAFPLAAGGAAPAFQINMAMTQGAVYDALNAIEPRYQPYLLQTRFDSSASKEAATATAAYRVLSNIVSTVPENIVFDRATLLERLTTEYNNSLNGIPPGPRDAGIAAGNAAADAMIAARHGEDFCPCADGRFGPSPWVPNDEPGHWQPLLDPITHQPQLDPTAWVANVRPFLIQSPSQFRTDGPNALTSTAYAEDFNEVKALGRIDSAIRTDEQTHIAIFWQSPQPWNAVGRNLIADPQYAVDIVDSALLFAMMNLSTADAAINAWNDKYYWDFWRPWAAIQRADEDGNPDTEPDPAWTALITAPYPENPSGACSLSGAHLEVLQMFFGTDRIRFGVTSSRFPGETRYFDRFSDALKEIIEARIWAGLHFRAADIQGKILGRKVVHYMARHYFQPVQ
ncbi:MAG TPA: vanadium-dependent haloperoxidase [Verrucomicrobiae bacterium]|nr:vanadium-dependent haloperoxidase [Verrucomicrobiae bacterium]